MTFSFGVREMATGENRQSDSRRRGAARVPENSIVPEYRATPTAPSHMQIPDAGHLDPWDLAPFGILILDGSRMIQSCNATAIGLFGVPRYHIQGHSILEFIAPGDTEVFARHWHDVESRIESRPCDLELLRSDGYTVFVEARIAPLVSADGESTSYRVVMHDITERRELLQELQDARTELADQLRDMERLQEISLRTVADGDLEPLLQEIVDVAIEIMRADAGSMMLIEEGTGDLLLGAHVGLRGTYLEACWRFDPNSFDTACGRAVKTGRRVIVPDILNSREFVAEAFINILSDSGIRGLESTPLVTRSGKVLGVMATQYRKPTAPNPSALRRMDLLARQAADLIERAQAESAIRESEQRLRGFFETAAVLTSIIDLREDDFVYTYPNARIAEFFGMTAEHLRGKSAREVGVPDAKIAECLQQFRMCETTKQPVTAEHAFPFGDNVYWYFGTISYIGEGPNGSQFSLTLIDITERKEAESALRASELRYRNYVDHASDAMLLLDADGLIIDVNDQTCRSLGYERHELIGKTPQAFEPIVTEAMFAEVCKRRNSEERISFDTINQRKDGTQFPVEVRARRYEIDGVEYWLAYVRDITDRKRSEEALQRSESRFRGAIENIPDVIVIYDSDLRIQFLNAATTEITGRPVSDFIGRRDDEVWPPKVCNTYIPILRETLEFKDARALETDIRFPNGDVRSLHIRCVPLLDDDGAVREIVGITHDLTERKKAEQATRESEQRFAQFMAYLPGLAWIKDAEGRYVYANEAAAADFKTSADQISGKLDTDLFPADVASEFVKSDRKVLVTGKGRQMHESRKDENGLDRHSLVSKFPIPSGDDRPPLVGGVAIDMTEWMQAEETVRRIVEGIAPTTGQDFFRTLASHLSSVCHVDFAFVSRFDKSEPNLLRSIAICSQGEMIENSSFDIRGTPCEHICNRGVYFQPSGVQAKFPDDKLLVELNVDSYMGASLFSSDGEPIGLVGLMHGGPIIHAEQAMAILKVIAARAGAELERDRAQVELDRTRLEFDFLAESFPSMVFRADAEGRSFSVNNARWTLLTGGEPDSWRGDGWLGAVHPQDRSRVELSWTKFVDGGLEWAEEFRFSRADGSVAWVLAQAVPIRDASGHTMEFFGACVDITHLIETKQALRLTQYSVDQASIGVYWADFEGRIRYVNDWACTSVGYSRSELMNMSMLQLTEHSPESWHDQFKSIKLNGSVSFETHHRRKDGTSFPVEVNVNYVRFGGEDFLFGFAQDVSERKQVEDRLERQSAELAHVSRLSTMGQMVATLSHELAQPLSAVANYANATTAQLRLSVVKDPILSEYLEGIVMQTTRAGDILRRVRDFVRKSNPKKARCDLNALLEDSLALLSNDFRRNRVRVISDLYHEPMPAVVDRVLIQQVIVNLLTNARDAIWSLPPSKRVATVRSFVEDESAVIEIEDCGPGIPAEIIDTLFDPFVTTKESGMGMGLSICRSIIVSHDGSILPMSGRSGGAMFRVILPLARDAVGA